jgi:predicted transcriptional regulator
VDVREAARLYEAGRTIAEVAAMLHVTPRTVVRNFDKAGIARRPRGTLPRDVPVSEIQRLRDKGLTMPEVAQALGITTSLAWRR